MEPRTSLALYIHIPYCLEKCPYCDFHSIATERRLISQKRYATCLVAQLRQETERLQLKGKHLTSIFFGGGTPSLMQPPFFAEVLEAVAKELVLLPETEITVETNPATAVKSDFQEWLKMGINRISFGVQSFQDFLLKKLGRNHSAGEAKQAIQRGLDVGFDNISCDLIFGIEGQTLEMLEKDLKTAVSFNLPHFSAYQLTIETGTPLASWVHAGTFVTPGEETLVAMQNRVIEYFENQGRRRYEISNYAKGGFESRHNLQYWRYQPYLGLGSGAVSFVANQRWRTTRKLKSYLDCEWNYEEKESIDAKTALKERWMMGLRLAEGVVLQPLDRHLGEGLFKRLGEDYLQYSDDRVRLTPQGSLFWNQVVQNIFDLADELC